MYVVNGFDAFVDGAEATSTASSLGIGDLHLHYVEENNFEGQVRMVEQCWDAHEFVEQRMKRTLLRGEARLSVRTLQSGPDDDRVNDGDLESRQQVVELVPHRREGRGLNFDEVGVISREVSGDVGDELIDRNLLLIAGPGVAVLERSVQRTLVQSADDRLKGVGDPIDPTAIRGGRGPGASP